MARTLTTSSAEQIIAQCERGIYQPWQGSEPIDLLARGMVESATGDLDKAKDLLSRAYWSLEGEWKDGAGVQLAVAYWRGGEMSEAWALLDTLPVGFDVLLAQAIIQTDSDPELALATLQRAEGYDVSRYKRGRLHNQRGMCFRLLGRPDLAREQYEAALYFFGDCPLRALVENNLAGVLEHEASHELVDKAISALNGSHLGQAYERKARTLLNEGSPEKALQYATWAVDLLEAAARRTWLIESLLTRAEIRERLTDFQGAFADLFHANELAEFLGDQALGLTTSKALLALGRTVSKTYHVRSVHLALSLSDSLNSAARKLGTSRQGLQDFMRANGLKHFFRPRRSIITKS